ncbi:MULTISPECIES: hypothetical protein [Aquimarina]|uniref:Uncharacterized protein n=2 Tax=Aquimarina algiphila TaxID=2047982 RepID=A0A554VF53_9FLAO|nr:MULTISPECIES: hypothetical protein [Aquimarina]TSE05765.1 hypothetical protein FOF46_21675 [Aquimarina algiphila]
MNNYKLTFIGFVVSMFIYIGCIILELDLFEKFVALLASLEQFEFDEIIIPIVVFFIFLFIDTARKSKEIKMENAKLNIYKAMLSSSHHILNTFIYQMNIFKITAEETPGFDKKVLVFYEEIIDNASHQINSLSNLTNIDELSIRASVMGQECLI